MSNEQAIEQSWVQWLVSKLAIVIELSNEQAIEQSWVLHKIGSSKRSPYTAKLRYLARRHLPVCIGETEKNSWRMDQEL